jgi:pimeloyl-ACP methyl ester carboxylesterase
MIILLKSKNSRRRASSSSGYSNLSSMSVQHPGLFYLKKGHGSKNLILFHGFGQDNSVFLSFVDTIADQYTCYCVDLYFHGKSPWLHNETPIEKTEWRAIIADILKENNLRRFSLLGFSLGAKFLLATLEAFPELIQEVFLIAPDGITTNPWYRLATSSGLLRRVFKSLINNHKRFIDLTGALGSLGMIDKSLLRFAEHQMNTELKRKRVYYSWVVSRRLSFDMKSIASLINKNNIQLTIVVGKFDNLIKPQAMNQILRHVPKHRFELLDVGHNQLLSKEVARVIFKS